MASSVRVAEDVGHVKSVSQKTQTTRRNIVQMKLNVQTVKKTNPLSKDLLAYTKERGKY